MEIKTTEFFRNMKKLPPRGSNEFQQLLDHETEKCLGGVTINGVKIPSWLYFHMNHWHLIGDAKDNYGNVIRIAKNPDLRDNEWIRSEALEECKLLSRGYMEVGLRQGGKSEFEASVTGWNSLFFQNTQNVIVGGNKNDLSLLTEKLGFGLSNMWEGLAIPRIDKDWDKPMVRLGFKDKNNEDSVWSYIVIRNALEGRRTEAPAGTTSKCFIIDECGKFPFGQVFEAAKPAFLSEFGWRTIPILVGTGGSFDKGADAERFFYNPDANNFLAFTNEETGERSCLFMSGLYRQDCKIEKTLAEWLIGQGREIKERDELDKLIIRVADKELAEKRIHEERLQKSRDPDKTEYLKIIMYNPLTAKECFLTTSSNIFDVESCRLQQNKLYKIGSSGTPVLLHNTEDGIIHEFTDKVPISSYPIKQNENKDAPILIYEFPIEDPPFGLYVAGIDPYRQGKSAYSSSLGAVYIYKRMHDISSEKYQDMFVASYVARPDRKETWEEQARLLIKYYNARALCENDEMSFIDYMVSKGDGHYLEHQPQWLKEIVPHTTVERDYGIHRSSDTIRDFLHTTLKSYLEDVLYREKDSEGSTIREILGVSRVLDPVLLEEIIKFDDSDKEKNFDRVVAAELAICLANKLNPVIGKVSSEEDPRYVALFGKKNFNEKPKLFNTGNNLFPKKKRRNLFH